MGEDTPESSEDCKWQVKVELRWSSRLPAPFPPPRPALTLTHLADDAEAPADRAGRADSPPAAPRDPAHACGTGAS